ncbi:hydroxypyruvate isomerase family protein [Neorhizobium sp. AL 9.2.2]|uniref:hydroxypyruvate isomerase family protein n=1 Tax=Neorhizobium sp. AL 9.2.2 TaxID=2712894 RepID=UPI001574D223|nr:TIM barrel protein [Neorhizobium sp. AL 9.2.2]NSY18544.1 TIM barrel protein [Neorhizobium sp. AL 9.2.2]
MSKDCIDLRSKLTANIAFMFAEMPFIERIPAAAAAGFRFVECHFPYDIPVERLAAVLDASGVLMTGINTAPGNLERGEWGLAGIRGQEAQFQVDFDQALEYAVALGARAIHVMAGVVGDPADRAEALRLYVENLRRVAKLSDRHGITLLLEPLNTRDKPDYLVSRSDDIVDIITEIAEPNVKLLIDVYHVQIMEGDLTRRIKRHAPFIGHVQLASVPDRWEPDLGEVNLRHVLAVLEEIEYPGLIGLEYRPKSDTVGGLSWIDRTSSAN